MTPITSPFMFTHTSSNVCCNRPHLRATLPLSTTTRSIPRRRGAPPPVILRRHPTRLHAATRRSPLAVPYPSPAVSVPEPCLWSGRALTTRPVCSCSCSFSPFLSHCCSISLSLRSGRDRSTIVATPKLRDSIEAPRCYSPNPNPSPPIGGAAHAKVQFFFGRPFSFLTSPSWNCKPKDWGPFLIRISWFALDFVVVEYWVSFCLVFGLDFLVLARKICLIFRLDSLRD